MKDYSAMSDFEINVDVSMELFEGSSGGDTSRIATWCACKENGKYGLFDPCNNPADAWPIIMANKISLMFDRSLEDGCNAEWCLASSPCDQIIVDHVMPDKILRAAMIVFLMMKESIHAKTSE